MSHYRFFCRVFFAMVMIATVRDLDAESPLGKNVDFTREIEPILRDHCFDCHGADEQEGQLRLDRLAGMRLGGDSGEPAIVPSKPEASYLLKLVRHEEDGKEMPPDGSLSVLKIRLLERWIAQGAVTPQHYGPPEAEVELTHWSFQPPEVVEASGIDELIQKRLAASGLTLSPRADRRTLIRRLYLVMLGLPPTPDQVQAFVNDDRDDAWPRLVETVLASPHYGQRWATYWLDLVRFGETHGFETNRERPNAWRYRDWVIQAFNHDLPYDKFIRQQIAGDALGTPIGTSFLVAGPYDLVKGKDPKLGQMQRMNELDDMINTTGTAFLGMTTGCARCHNHKFDPITQRDYYAMQAVFAGVKHSDRDLPLSPEAKRTAGKLATEIASLKTKLERFLPSEKLTQKNREPVNARLNEERFEKRMVDRVRFIIRETNNGSQACLDELEIYSDQRNVALASEGAKATSSGDFVHPLHKLAHINDGQHGNQRSWIVDSPKGGWVQIEFPTPTMIDRIVWGRDRTGKYTDRLVVNYEIQGQHDSEDWFTITGSSDRVPYQQAPPSQPVYRFDGFPKPEADLGRRWLARLDELKRKRAALVKPEQVYAGTFSQPGPTHRLYRGEPGATREQVSPGGIRTLNGPVLDRDSPEQRRRLALADWIASDKNPLTARVIVNRLWQFHFGTGIVDTPSDFGRNGAPPTHPKLLDWLATELITHGWSLKHIHRRILHSATWQQSNHPDPQAMTIDAASRLLWRFPPRRLEAEAIRDSILVVSDSLNRDRSGGPGFSPFEVQMENVRHYHAKETYGPEDWRRMVFMTRIRQEREQVFGVFDCPDASMVVPKRSRSTTPLQALNLLNSGFVMQQAELFAVRLQRERSAVDQQVQRAWQLCFQRPPHQDEVDQSVDFIHREGLLQFTRALLNTNEFVFVP